MADTVLHIDNQKIDAEILAFEEQIAAAQAHISTWQEEIGFRKRLKQYLLSHNGNAAHVAPEESSDEVGGPTDFVIAYLQKHNKAKARPIIAAYAESMNLEYDDVRSNVFNSLSRLKRAGRLDTEDAIEGKGDVWFIKK